LNEDDFKKVSLKSSHAINIQGFVEQVKSTLFIIKAAITWT